MKYYTMKYYIYEFYMKYYMKYYVKYYEILLYTYLHHSVSMNVGVVDYVSQYGSYTSPGLGSALSSACTGVLDLQQL